MEGSPGTALVGTNSEMYVVRAGIFGKKCSGFQYEHLVSLTYTPPLAAVVNLKLTGQAPGAELVTVDFPWQSDRLSSLQSALDAMLERGASLRIDVPGLRATSTGGSSVSADSPANGSEPIMFAKGANGQIELHDTKVVLRRQGMLAMLTQGFKGDKEIFLRNITAVQIRMPGSLTRGYLQLTISGGKESTGGLFAATSDENSVMFDAPQAQVFVQFKEELERRIHNQHIRQSAVAPAPASTASLADEIRKLSQLRDEGILTEEEFQAKKRQILGIL